MPAFDHSVLVHIKDFLTHLPVLAKFLFGVTIFLLIPSLSQRLRLPGLVGLILTGILLGQGGFDLFPDDRPVLDMCSEVGKLLILFYAGMEVDLDLFRRKKAPSISFGLLTLVLPLSAGVLIGRAFGYGWNAAMLIGSLVASHTLLAFPLVQRAGIAGREPIMVTAGATILTDVVALLILAVCVSIHTTGFSAATLGVQVLQVIVYAVLVVAVVARIAGKVMAKRRVSHDGEMMGLMAIVLVCSMLAEVIHLEPIVGAFLAGLAVSRALHGSEAKAHLDTLGNTIFLPAFFLALGLGIDARATLRSIISDWPIVLALLGGLLATKFMAAWITGALFKYPRPERWLMWSLTLPQVAATIAATLVAHNTMNAQGERLIGESVVNGVLVLVLLTAAGGPILTGRYLKPLAPDPLQPGTAPSAAAPVGAATAPRSG